MINAAAVGRTSPASAQHAAAEIHCLRSRNAND